MKRRTAQPEIRSFVLLLRSPVTPFDSSGNFTKNANCFEECNIFGNGMCELSAIQDGRNLRANFCQGKVQKLFTNTKDSKVQIFGKEKCKTHRQL